jgi:hypothetical protein
MGVVEHSRRELTSLLALGGDSEISIESLSPQSHCDLTNVPDKNDEKRGSNTKM